MVDGNFLIFFVGGDNPAKLLLLSGRTVHGAPSGEKTLVSSSGGSEDLCQTLA